MAERGLRIPAGEGALEARLHLPDPSPGAPTAPVPAVVICHPHPRYGGDMHNNVVTAVAAALAPAGVAVLRFNFRGVGQSDGVHDDGRGEQDDVRAAMRYAAARPEIDGARVGLAGYSFGAAMAAAVACDADAAGGTSPVPALALISAPPALLARVAPALATYAGRLLLAVGDRDELCPTDALLPLVAPLGERARTELVIGADHFWAGHDRTLAATVAAFFAQQLQASG